MKRTQIIDLLSTIKGSIVSFFAITMFVALGAGLFLGIHWIAGSMHTMAGTQFADGNAHDVEITFPYGLTDENIERLRSVDQDMDIEEGYLSFQQIKTGDDTRVVRVGTLPQRIDTFVSVNGTLPKETNEIALEVNAAMRMGLGIGDTITFLPDDGKDGTRFLNAQRFRVTALVISPAYLAKNSRTYGTSYIGSGSVDAVSWVVPEAFNTMSFLGAYPYVAIKSPRLARMDPFSDEYKRAVAELTGKISAMGDGLSNERLNMLKELRSFLETHQVQKLSEWQQSYANIENRHDKGLINDAQYQGELKALEDEITATLVKDGFDKELISPLDYTIIGTIAILKDTKLGEGEDNIIRKLREGLSSLTDYAWVVLSRTYNGAVLVMESFADITANLRWSMASLFLVVGLLVCYSAVSRLVHEQVMRIGTKKALGFYKTEISKLFLGYAGLCVALGMVLGVAVAVLVVERILLRFIGARFVLPMVPYINVGDIALIGALEIVLILAVTWFAVSGVLKRQAVDLLAGEHPTAAKKRFYEEWGVWKRMGLLGQITVNNCINDRRRVVATLVGVAGCTALIVCAVMLYDNVLRSFNRQYQAISHYQVTATVQAGSKAAKEGVSILESKGMEACEVMQRRFTLRMPNGGMSIATVTVPFDEDDFAKAMTIIPLDQAPNSKGVWVSEAYKEHLGAKVGDVVTLVDLAGNRSELPIAGFFEWHMLSHQIIMSPDLYQKSFDDQPLANKLLVNTMGGQEDDVDAALSGTQGYVSTLDDHDANRASFNEISSIAKIVVAVYLGLAVVMAACVLLNLDFMFVNEKKRELIVLMINGFSLRDAKGYIWHDSVVLTVLGIVLGMVLGSSTGGLTIYSIEQANASFLHDVSGFALCLGALGTVVLASAALLVALHRIGSFKLTDINRF